MINYTTRKQKFQQINELLNDNMNFEIRFDGFSQISSFEDADSIYLSYKSNIHNLICKKCNSVIRRNKGYRSTFPIIAKYNNKNVVASFQKKIFFCLIIKSVISHETDNHKLIPKVFSVTYISSVKSQINS